MNAPVTVTFDIENDSADIANLKRLLESSEQVFKNIGGAVGSIIFADGVLNFAEVRAKLRSEKDVLLMCGVNSLTHLACKDIAEVIVVTGRLAGSPIGSMLGARRLPTDDVAGLAVDITRHDLVSDPNNICFDSGSLYKVKVVMGEAGNSTEKVFYIIAGIKSREERYGARKPASAPRGQTKAFAHADGSPYRASDAVKRNATHRQQGERERAKLDRNPMPPTTSSKRPGKSGHSNLTSDCRPKGVSLRDSIPADVRRQLATADYPVYQDPEADNGRPRKKAGKKKEGKGNRNDRRFK